YTTKHVLTNFNEDLMNIVRDQEYQEDHSSQRKFHWDKLQVGAAIEHNGGAQRLSCDSSVGLRKLGRQCKLSARGPAAAALQDNALSA
ncbi:jg6309, partial [Pararge aegeria aegeria]